MRLSISSHPRSLWQDMNALFEGDLIRPLGLVTLNFAYAEAELDELLADLLGTEPHQESSVQWPVGQKLAHAQSLVERLNAPELSELASTLMKGRVLIEQRNALVHGSIFAGGRVRSTRPGVPEQRVTPEQLTELADSIFTWKEHIHVHRHKHVRIILALRRKACGT